jgi:hypothetical protein
VAIPKPPKPALPPGLTIELYKAAKAAVSCFSKPKKKKRYARSRKKYK